MTRWTLGLLVGLAVFVGMNGVLIYLSVRGGEPVAASYLEEHR